MSESENRHIARDSLFLMADMRVDGQEDAYRIKVRNLSARGMMGEGRTRVIRGAMVEVNIRNVGWVEGTVAWVQETRFGVAFAKDIDPKLAREPVGHVEDPAPNYVRNYQARFSTPVSDLRKI